LEERAVTVVSRSQQRCCRRMITYPPVIPGKKGLRERGGGLEKRHPPQKGCVHRVSKLRTKIAAHLEGDSAHPRSKQKA